MRHLGVLLVVVTVVLEASVALRCYQCFHEDKECRAVVCEPDETFCFGTSYLNGSGVAQEARSCANSAISPAFHWHGDCLNPNIAKPGKHSCRCFTDLCNADCKCNVTRTKHIVGDRVDHPVTSAPTTLQCRVGGRVETCKSDEISCQAIVTVPARGPYKITRRCSRMDSLARYWDRNHCLRIPLVGRTEYGCRCFVPKCNDDCGCGVPDFDSRLEAGQAHGMRVGLNKTHSGAHASIYTSWQVLAVILTLHCCLSLFLHLLISPIVRLCVF